MFRATNKVKLIALLQQLITSCGSNNSCNYPFKCNDYNLLQTVFRETFTDNNI